MKTSKDQPKNPPKKILSQIRIAPEIFEALEEKALEEKISTHVLRKKILHEYLFSSGEKKQNRVFLDFENSAKKRKFSITINSSLVEKIDALICYGSRSSLIEKLLITFLTTENIVLSKDDIALLNRLKNEVQSIGRNINQITRAVNVELKINNDPTEQLSALTPYLKKLKKLIKENNDIIKLIIARNNGAFK